MLFDGFQMALDPHRATFFRAIPSDPLYGFPQPRSMRPMRLLSDEAVGGAVSPGPFARFLQAARVSADL